MEKYYLNDSVHRFIVVLSPIQFNQQQLLKTCLRKNLLTLLEGSSSASSSGSSGPALQLLQNLETLRFSGDTGRQVVEPTTVFEVFSAGP